MVRDKSNLKVNDSNILSGVHDPKETEKNKSIKKFRIGLLIDNLNLDYFFFRNFNLSEKNPNIELFF